MDWFVANFMILNPDKCHFLFSAPKTVVEQLYIQVGDQIIWESLEKKLLGVTVDKNMQFEYHMREICKKASMKLSVLTRWARI